MQHVNQVSTLKTLSRIFWGLFASAILFSCTKDSSEISTVNPEPTVPSSSSQAEHINLIAIPFERTVFVPCANGGAGEEVLLTGSVHLFYQLITNNHGVSLVYQYNYVNVTGVGLSSGETFVASGGVQSNFAGAWFNGISTSSTVEQMRVIGNNTTFIVKYKSKYTVTPDGNVTVSISDETADCKL